MASYINQSLDTMILACKNDRGEIRMNTRANNSSRNNKDKSFRNSRPPTDKVVTPRPTPKLQSIKSLISIKFLISNAISGSMIGPSGSAIKELMDITSARASVSASWETYPGSLERIMLITGKPEEVIIAQALVWDNLALQGCEEGFVGRAVWSPTRSKERIDAGLDDTTMVSGKITIPEAAGGLIIGRAGATIRSLSDLSGASVQMNMKDESEDSNERVLIITGTNKACCECLTLIIEKLVEGGPEFSQYEDDHHMDLLAKQINREDRQIVKNQSSLSSDRYTHDDGRERERERERDNRKVVLSDSRSISPLPPTPRGSTQRNISLNMSSLRDNQFNPVGSSSRDSGDAWDGDRTKRDGPDTRRTKERVRDWQREHQDKERERAIYGDAFGRNGSKDQTDDMSDNSHFMSMSTQLQDRERERDFRDRERERERDNKEYRRSSPYTTYNSSSASTPFPVSRPVSRPSSRANSQSNTPREAYGSGAQPMIFTTSKTYRTPAESSRDREQDKAIAANGFEVLSANTTINVAIPDSVIGYIYGRQSVTLHEIINTSGAAISVSPRGQFIEGTTNRLVTITGTPANAQTAHSLILKALQQDV